jgi:hypothetical protein
MGVRLLPSSLDLPGLRANGEDIRCDQASGCCSVVDGSRKVEGR